MFSFENLKITDEGKALFDNFMRVSLFLFLTNKKIFQMRGKRSLVIYQNVLSYFLLDFEDFR